MKRKVRKSIWDANGPSKFENDFSPKDRSLSILRYVEHAKKQTGILCADDLRKIKRSIETVPRSPSKEDIKAYLVGVCGLDSVGIPIAICMLSRIRNSEFPPFDKFVLRGLLKADVINQDEFKILNRKNIDSFSDIYVDKVLKCWLEKIENGHKPSEIDELWVSLGKTP
tara:strand:+ start:1484 stop:1990 length:507 start_codon:yes stop_codon:yes gene_type:complete